MWKCPKCETLNSGDTCVICGEGMPAETAVVPPEAPVVPAEAKAKKTNKAAIWISVVAGVVILALIAVIVVMAMNGSDKEQVVIDEPEVEQEDEFYNPVADEPEFDEEKVDTAQNDDEDAYIMGSIDDDVYENELIGVGIRVDSDWRFFDKSELASVNGMAADMLGEDVAEFIENSTSITVMQASDVVGNNVNFTVQQMPWDFDHQSYTELMAEQLPAVFEQMDNVAVLGTQTCEVVIDSEVFYGVDIQLEMLGIQMYQRMIVLDADGYLALATITSMFDDSTIDEVVDNMYLLD